MAKISDELRRQANCIRSLNSKTHTYKDPCKIERLADRIDAEMVELPRDADGVPIHIDDTVCDPSGSECTVISLHLYGEEAPSWMADVNICGYGQTVTARRGQSELTHERPDSLERIVEDIEAFGIEADINDAALEFLVKIQGRICKLAKESGHE